MRTSPWIDVIATIALTLLTTAGSASATDDDGEHLYRQDCARCHGLTGRGDGPDAAIFVTRPRDLSGGWLNTYSTNDLVRRVREGRALELALDPPALATRATDVENLVTYLTRFPTINWRLAESGSALYVDRCESCHDVTGARLPAGVKPPRDLGDPAFQKSVSDTELVDAVRHGREGMPALTPRIPKDDGPALVAFLRLLSPGFQLYSRDCAGCHGDDGRGVGSFGEAIRLPTATFDRQYFATHDAEYLRTKVWHMAGEHRPTMPHYSAVLSEAQARALIEYLKRLTSAPASQR